ncbi:MAG: glycosyltransferase [Weeksellaceae bacterium]|nr:glycosyltransferase [Weeksellaceae bacterium]
MINYIMLTWNRKAFLEELFKDFFKKITIEEFNFFIIDNGSTDGSKEFLKELEQKDERIKIEYNSSNNGLLEYKKLFKRATKENKYIIIVDDDVLNFPESFDSKLIDALENFSDVGFIALDVVQDDKTNGAKPDKSLYHEYEKNGISLQVGPVGGWCSIISVKDYKKISFFMNIIKLNMARGEDASIVWFLKHIFRKKSGILKNVTCLHAAGPYYSKKYGYLERDIKNMKIPD